MIFIYLGEHSIMGYPRKKQTEIIQNFLSILLDFILCNSEPYKGQMVTFENYQKAIN